MNNPFYLGRLYRPITPQADTDELAQAGPRLMFRHTFDGPVIFTAPKDELTAGWVIGVFYSV